MDSSEARLDIVEAQRSTDDQQKRRYFLTNLINKGSCRLGFRGFLPCGGDGTDATLPTKDTEYVPVFLTNLRFSDLYNLPGESVEMNSETLTAMRAGNRKFLEKMKKYETPMACFKNDKGDSILHLAAYSGHLELVKSIVSECPSLLLEPNWKGQIPLHVAACAGHSAVVKALVSSITFFSDRLAEEGRERLNPYVLKDKDGNTPLHLTLEELHEETERLRSSRSISLSTSTITHLMKTATLLMNVDQHSSFLANNDGISPLYLAVEAGNENLVNAMLNLSYSDLASQLEGRKSLVHAALKAKLNTHILDVILNKGPSLGDERDEEGRTCLSVGASVGYYKGVRYLLNRSKHSLFVSDDDGYFPIHMAAKYGHVKILNEILKLHRDEIESLSKNGQNIIHVAAKNGQLKSIKFILRCYKDPDREKKSLNEQDRDGNTPLHLATQYRQPKVVSMLTWDDRVDVKIQNKEGYTALDIAVENMSWSYSMLEILTWIPLVSADAPRGSKYTLLQNPDLSSGGSKHDTLQNPDLSSGPDGAVKEELVNTLLLVATLVATMTFTAGFALPGAYNSFGMAALAKKKAFQVFLVFNTLAMYSSIITIVALIWAQLGDPSLMRKALTLALPLLGISLTFMSMAFMSGTFAAVSHLPLLAYFILGIGLIFLVFFLLIIIPYVSPKFSTNPFLRHIFYFPYFLLLWAVGDNKNNE